MTGGYLDSLAVTLSTYGEVLPALLVLSVLYWCIDKRLGQYLLIGWGYNRLANGFAKITVCAYRPWIRDPRVQPIPSTIAAATGYSFPSGHTCNATSIYGGLACDASSANRSASDLSSSWCSLASRATG